MVFFNYSTMQMAAKVVYYGPGLCGKTTNLQFIYGHTSGDSRGEMVSLETETDRTLFFDLLPIDVGTIAGFSTRIQLYTVPGQVFYNTTRKLVLKGVDGVVFVADSQRPMLQANVDSFKNLEENLAEMGLAIDTIPLVLQFNKRDLPSICTPDELNQALNRNNWPYFEASAIQGVGVFETLKGISKLTLMALKKKLARDNEDPPRTAPPSVTQSQALRSQPPAQAPAPAARPAPASPVIGSPPPAPAPTVRSAAPAAPTGTGSHPLAPSGTGSHPAVASGTGSHPAATRPASGTGSHPAAPRAVQSRADLPPVTPREGERAKRRSKQDFDVLGELEKIRREVKRPGRGQRAARPVNGHGELTREIQLTLKRDDFRRLRRFSLNLQVEDQDHRVVEAVRNFHVDIEDPTSLEKVLLRLSIALNAKG